MVQGKGTTNTGNVGRKFFSNWEMTARITGVEPESQHPDPTPFMDLEMSLPFFSQFTK